MWWQEPARRKGSEGETRTLEWVRPLRATPTQKPSASSDVNCLPLISAVTEYGRVRSDFIRKLSSAHVPPYSNRALPAQIICRCVLFTSSPYRFTCTLAIVYAKAKWRKATAFSEPMQTKFNSTYNVWYRLGHIVQCWVFLIASEPQLYAFLHWIHRSDW
jgi:hypothetical protein